VGELTLRYGLPFNILHGKMTQTAHGVFGQLWVHVVATENTEQYPRGFTP
jgi:D-methionine transport system ATP-binding protein